MHKKYNHHDLNSTINHFLKELPDATQCSQSVFRKELSFNGKTVILVAQQIKGSTGMSWNVNVC